MNRDSKMVDALNAVIATLPGNTPAEVAAIKIAHAALESYRRSMMTRAQIDAYHEALAFGVAP